MNASAWLLLLVSLPLAACSGERDDTDGQSSELVVDPGEGGGSASSTRTIKIVHWNIAGAVLNYGFNDVMDKVLDEFEARKPDVISINEACRDQIEYLRDELRHRGYAATMQFSPSGNLNAACVHSPGTNTAQQGPAIIAVAGGSNGQSHYWRGTQSVDGSGDRGMACVTADLGKPVRLCSLHIATDDNEAAGQVESMIGRWRDAFRDNPHLIIGDYNASPDFFKAKAPNLYAPAGTFYEADAPANQATHGEGKLDYIFMSKNHFEERGHVEIKDMGRHNPWWGTERAFSDHRLVYGTVSLRL
jgi:endonuclease/exonuclease/phosphatase family metal-dependent hydrolase